jgi:hypothetical protein
VSNRDSRRLLRDSSGLLETRNVVLGHDVVMASSTQGRDASLAIRIRVDGARNAAVVKCGAACRRRIPRMHPGNLTGLVWLALSTRRVRIPGEYDTAKCTAQNYC